MTSTYFLLQDADGKLLSARQGNLTFCSLADDHCLWVKDDNLMTCLTSGLSLTTDSAGQQFIVVQQGDMRIRCQVRQGPSRRPSEHLEEIRQTGATVIDGILLPAELDALRQSAARRRARDHSEEPPFDGHFWMMGSLLWAPEVARACTHPVALWVIRQYMGTDEIHLCHQPVITTLKPARELKGQFPANGWHSDYPYHQGVFPHNHWPASPVFGVQFNTCIDPFTTETGATQYVPGSHQSGAGPPAEMNEGGTHAGKGIHRDVAQFIAPAGSALIYDSRTWHRACPELNVSGQDRMAILNAVAPAWVRPMMDKRAISQRYAASAVPARLNARERAETDRLCHQPVQPTPDGMPQLTARQA